MKSTSWRVFGALLGVTVIAVAYSKMTESQSIADVVDARTAVEAELTEAPPTVVPPSLAKESPAIVKEPPVQVPVRKPVTSRPRPLASRTSVNADSYTVKVSVPAKVAAGATGKVRVTLAVKTGWKINQEFPTKLIVTAPGDVTLAKAKLRAKDATSWSEKKGVFDVVFTPSASGGKDFSAKFRFAVCTDATCDPKTEKLTWQVSVD